MKVAYKFFRCNQEGVITATLLIFPDATHYVYNSKGAVGAYFSNVLSIEVLSLGELKRILGEVQGLGLVEVDLEDYLNAGGCDGLPYNEFTSSLNVGFRCQQHDYYTLVIPEVMKYGVLATRNTMESQVDLVVTVKRVADLQHFEWVLSRGFGFKDLKN